MRLPITFELGLMALIVALIVGIPIGVYSAVRQDTVGDYVTRSFSILLLALPGFWVGTLVMVFPSIWWGWSPEVKYISFTQDPLRNLAQMIVPALILGKAFSAVAMRLTRTMMLEVMRQDYIRTALAKGLRAHHHHPPCAAQRADPGGDPGRPAGAGAGRRHRHHGADLRHPRHGPAAARGGEPARLSDHHRRVPGRRRRRGADQPPGRSQLRAARSQGEVPLMAPVAEHPPPPRGAAPAAPRSAFLVPAVPRQAARRRRRRDLRDLPVLRHLRRRAGALRLSTRSARSTA